MTIEAVASRILSAESAFWFDWIRGLKELEGDPYAVEVATFASVTAGVTNTPVPPFNRARGRLDAGDDEAIGELVAFYRRRGLPSVVELSPYETSIELSTLLAKHGFVYSMPLSQTYLQREDAARETPEGVEIVDLDASDETAFAAFCRIQSTCFGQGSGLTDAQAQDIFGGFVPLDAYRCFLAYVGGEPAGACALYRQQGAGVLVAGATLPAYQRRGVQTAMLIHRVRVAWAEGCDVVTATASPGSSSLRNMERVGMRKAFDKVILYRP